MRNPARLGPAYVVLLGAPVVAVALLAVTGGLALSVQTGLAATDDVVQVALPAVQALRSVGAVLTVGALVVASCCLRPGAARDAARDLATTAALVWGSGAAALVGLTFADATGTEVLGSGFFDGSWYFAQNFELGRYLAAESAIAALVVVLGLATRGSVGLGVSTIIALVGLWPMALTGHAAGTLRHDAAVDLQLFHWAGVAVWLGGLATVLAVARRSGDDLAVALQRWSRLAAWSLVLVTGSGVLGAALRLGRWSALATPYGALVVVKVVALSAAVALGWWQRRRLVDQIADGRRVLGRLLGVEVAVLAFAAGAGVALSRTATPSPPGRPVPLTPAQAMLGRDLPGAPDLASWFTAWNLNVLWLVVAVLAVAWYVAAAHAMRVRGDRWPVGRIVCWVFGWALFTWATSGAPGAYDRVLFSMHMVQHMTVALAVPTFLVLAAPITLALRTLPRRRDGSSGPREWLQRAVESLPLQLLAHPVVAAAMVLIGLVAFYYSAAFELSLETHTGHNLMMVHFLTTGYLFASVLIGRDPGVLRPAYPIRALIVMLVFGAHALFSVSFMASTQVLAEDWYAALGRTWGDSLIDDQYRGASIGWVLGDYPLAILAVALVVQWARDDHREQRRLDRRADRDGDAELAAYNNRLGRLASSARDRHAEETP